MAKLGTYLKDLRNYRPKQCTRCGVWFKPTATNQRLCPECRGLTQKDQNKRKKDPHSLDKKLKRLEASGQTYADAQKQETKAMFAKVDLSDFKIKAENRRKK